MAANEQDQRRFLIETAFIVFLQETWSQWRNKFRRILATHWFTPCRGILIAFPIFWILPAICSTIVSHSQHFHHHIEDYCRCSKGIRYFTRDASQIWRHLQFRANYAHLNGLVTYSSPIFGRKVYCPSRLTSWILSKTCLCIGKNHLLLWNRYNHDC
jgi:hypothetical protein